VTGASPIRWAPGIPIFRMFDEALTKEFYVDFLGFTIVFEHRFDANAPLYMGVVLGDCAINLSGHFGDATPGSAVRIETTPLAQYCLRFVGSTYKFARPGLPNDQTWGCRELTIDDPSGNKLTFFENLPAP
jgi:catechol 2,3-dioxygenase-like lactoylglutathione lyase family enzyme